MYAIQLGSFVLNGEIILYIAFGFAGWFALRLRVRRWPEREALLATASSAFLPWILVWKGSLILLDPSGFFQYPASLLYYSGGERGRWIAGGVAALYVVYRVRKHNIPIRTAAEGAVIYCLGGWSGYQLLLAVIDNDELIRHLGAAGLTALLLWFWIFRRARNLAVLLLAVVLVGYGLYDELADRYGRAVQVGNNEVGTAKGQQAPNFELLDMEGNRVELSDYRGERVLINFWATWCPPCRAEMPHMQSFYEDFQAKGVVVLGINLTSTEKSADVVPPFAERFGLRFPILLDSEGDVMSMYHVRGYPTTYVLDSSGTVRETFIGAIDYETMKGAVENVE